MYLKDKGPVRSVTKEEKILSLQCPSTRRALQRPTEDDAEWRSRSIPANAQCLKEDGTVDLNVRQLTQQVADFHQELRYNRGSVIQALKDEEIKHTLTEEKKEKAVHAFMAKITLGALKERFKSIMSGLFKPEYAEVVATQMKQSAKEMKEKP